MLVSGFIRPLHIHEIFTVDEVEVKTEESSGLTGNELKKVNHDNYKKAYKKYAKLKYIAKGETSPKEVGKREYDKAPDGINQILNENIVKLNAEVRRVIEDKDHRIIRYNDSRFDRFNDLSFGHDSLLRITSLLFQRYPKLGKILCDKYDFILVDEYQDTRRDVVEVFLNHLPKDKRTTIGLFGDAMQSIYSDGIGAVSYTHLTLPTIYSV